MQPVSSLPADSPAELGRRPASRPVHDLAIVIVSTNEANWLEPCRPDYFREHRRRRRRRLVVVDNETTDETRSLVESRFPWVRLVNSRNHGFSHANNRGAATCSSRYVLFLNPDTEIASGSFAEMVAAMDERPEVGLAGVRQLDLRRHTLADDPLLPEYSPCRRRGPRVGEVAATACLERRTRARPGRLRARARVRLDLRIVPHGSE